MKAVIKYTLIITLLFLTVLIALMILSSRYYPKYKNSVHYNERSDLLVLFTYSIPFVGDLDVEMLGDVEIYPVETDEYGRTLGILQFKPRKRNQLFGENAVYCVLQSGSKKKCCYYEDVCCVMVENGTDSSAAIQQLKRDNDWNMPLAIGKCRTIPIKYYNASGDFNTKYGYHDYETPACKAVMWPTENAWLEVLCKDGCGLWLFTLVLNCHKENSPVYLIMMREDPSADPMLSIVGTQPLNDQSSPWAEIHAFKEEMGWQFSQSGADS